MKRLYSLLPKNTMPDLSLLMNSRRDQHAARIGLPFKGTLGILQEAKKEGLIDVIKPLLIQLQNNGMHLSESLINNALQDAGETD